MPSVQTDTLDIAYEDSGPPGAPVILLLHGWPDDASTWAQVAPRLNEAGLHTITPTLRGFGQTRFRTPDAPRTGDSAILAMDAIALLDQLGIDRVCVAGHDWGSNIAEALAVGWPQRILRIALMSSPPRLGGIPTPPFQQAQRQWYHWFMATKRGAQALRDDPHGFAHIHWVNWAPAGWFDERTFEQTVLSFDNPDWVDVTLHSYRARWGNAEPDPRSAGLEAQVRATPSLAVPCLYIQGEVDGVNPPAASAGVHEQFTGPFERVVLPGVGHFPQREAPAKVADLLIGHFTASST